ncbi:hypothetical protein M413DRAFT_11164 [Hebeloma cylindrosporum]|uniref:Uncharacterized protein n=1 Tax=Hebeloma cylindrosporum TaxID=76867 RepID=A0A0C3BW52_HEBCY|nr:hypothetical protein M413DRAFT_11164 [Hebeloma cylindrosporum h7]
MSELESEFYNIESARNKLSSITQDRRQISEETGSGLQLANANLSGLFVQEFHNPASWRLSRIDEYGANEVVEFRLQGVISAKLLPPIAPTRGKHAARQYPRIKQAVTITGLGCSAFDDVVPTIEQIFYMFMDQVPDSMDVWKPEQFGDYEAIATENRLFTSRTLVPDVVPIPFDPLVDSNGSLTELARLSGGRFIHTSDNQVEYLGPINGSNGSGNIPPRMFRVGDIVELSVSFVAWPTRNGNSQMKIQLKSIRQLDREETTNKIIYRKHHEEDDVHTRGSKAKEDLQKRRGASGGSAKTIQDEDRS